MSSSKLTASNEKGALAHLRSLLEFNDNKRPWGFLLTVSLAVGLPVVIATWLGDFSAGVLASMGGLSSVYLRQTPLSHRLITMGLVTFGFCASFVISLVAGFSTWGAVAALAGVAFWATFICRCFCYPSYHHSCGGKGCHLGCGCTDCVAYDWCDNWQYGGLCRWLGATSATPL